MTSLPLVAGDVEANASVQVHPVSLTWRDVSYTVPEKKRGEGVVDKRFLHDISGYAEAGSVTTIIGASGSGNTSLLGVLADRLLYSKGATLTGKLLLNGETPPNDYRSRCASSIPIRLCVRQSRWLLACALAGSCSRK